jgi:hypothetical protein
MVVEHDRPGKGGVRGLEVRVAAVLRVPDPVVGQREDLGRGQMATTDRSLAAALVDVVAEEGDQIEVLPGQVGVRGVETVRAVLATGECECEPVG